MAQTEDTELRDLIIESLEKNGSLAKVRALLRANIFLAFEDECDNVKQNPNLDSVLKLPEGILSFSIVHEFLEYCNLKNTLFVYMAESRQGRDYNYENKRKLFEKFNLKTEASKEPILITLIKLYSQKKHAKENEKGGIKKNTDNCTYTVEDLYSTVTSNSQSDTSSDEKSKLHLRLQLDNSDTDTSNDSTRDKVSSEYFPSQQIGNNIFSQHSSEHISIKDSKNRQIFNEELDKSKLYQNIKDLKVAVNSSESTSYAELKPFSTIDEKLINTAGVPVNDSIKSAQSISTDGHINNDSLKSTPSMNNTSAVSMKEDSSSRRIDKETPQEKEKTDIDTAEYSFDFSSSISKQYLDDIKNCENVTKLVYQSHKDNLNKDSSSDSQHRGTQSSISISDVADLISEKSSSLCNQTNHDKSVNNKSRFSNENSSRKSDDSYKSKVLSDDSGDFTESPIASLSNLSLDIHSD